MLHRAHVIVCGLLLERALPHDIGAQRRVPDVGGVVNGLGQFVDHGHVIAEGGPIPADGGGHGFGGNVFSARDVADDHVALRGGAGGEREAAIAHHCGGDAMPARAAPQRVPKYLRIHVRVAVDKAGRNHLPGGVDFFLAALFDAPDGGDAIAFHADIRAVSGQPGAVDYRAVTYH